MFFFWKITILNFVSQNDKICFFLAKRFRQVCQICIWLVQEKNGGEECLCKSFTFPCLFPTSSKKASNFHQSISDRDDKTNLNVQGNVLNIFFSGKRINECVLRHCAWNIRCFGGQSRLSFSIVLSACPEEQ